MASTSCKTAFTYEDDVTLIECVRKNRALYDNTYNGHDDTDFKDAVWNDISIRIGKSVYQCKRRWKNIKSTYIKSKKKTESGSANRKSMDNWSLAAYVSFLDTVQIERNKVNKTATTTPNVRTDESGFEHEGRGDFKSTARDNEITSSETDISHFSSPENREKTTDDKIAITLAEGLKERNDMLYNTLQRQMEILDNTSFTVTVQYDHNGDGPSARNSDETKYEFSGEDEEERDSYGSVRDDFASPAAPRRRLWPVRSPQADDESYYLAEKLAQSKERNAILYQLLRQIETFNNRTENTKSLDLFFKSVSVDIEDLCPRAIDEVKPKILKCVSDVREAYYANASPTPTPPQQQQQQQRQQQRPESADGCRRRPQPDDENATARGSHRRRRIGGDPVDNQLEVARSTDLFFKSVSADVGDFCVRAIDDVKLGILKCVSDVKRVYSNRYYMRSAGSSAGNSATDNYAADTRAPAAVNRANNATAAAPAPAPASAPAPAPQDARNQQGYVTYYNVPVPTVPVYCNEQTNFTQSYY